MAAADDTPVEFTPQTRTPETMGARTYSIVFVGEFQSGGRLDGPVALDPADLAAVLGRARPTLALSIAAPFGGGGAWEFQLVFDTFKRFEPAGFLAGIPAGRWRLGLREKVLERRGGRIGASDLDHALHAAASADASLAWVTQSDALVAVAPPAGPIPAPPSGASILDLVDAPNDASRVAADVARAAAAAGDPAARLPAEELKRLDAILHRLSLELSAVADAVLKHPEFRRLETAWRCLRLLVERIDFRAGVRLWLLDAPRDELVARLVDQVITPAFDGELPTPGMIVLDHSFTNNPADFELLDELGQHAAGLPVPLVFPLEPQFFNVKSLRLLKNLPALPGLVDEFPFAKWRALRDRPCAKSIVPVLGRFILRAPYAPVADAADFTPHETVREIGDLVWAGGHVAMALCAARAFAAHGWPTRMFGAQAGKIENLPVVPNPNEPNSVWGPGDLALPDRRLDELPTVGINFLLSVQNHDYCYLLGGVSAARPIKTADKSTQQAALEVSLPYQQFANVASAALCEMMPALRGLAPRDVQLRLLASLTALLGASGADDAGGEPAAAGGEDDPVQVGVGESPDAPGKTLVQVRLTPPARIVPGGLHMDFTFAL